MLVEKLIRSMAHRPWKGIVDKLSRQKLVANRANFQDVGVLPGNLARALPTRACTPATTPPPGYDRQP